MTRQSFVAYAAVSIFALTSAAVAESIETEGRVSAVTVYQGQALVTRLIDLPEARGLVEVVVTDLPENVLPGSLFAEPIDGVQVRSVRYRARPIEEDVRKEVRELDGQIQNVQDQLAALSDERNVLNQRKAYLTQLEQFAAVTSRQELRSGVLNADTLKTLTEFLFAERDTISKRELEIAIEERTGSLQRDLLTRQRDTVASKSSRTIREAIVFINAPQAEAAKLRLSYLVGNASWSPSYNVRATTKRDEITIEYNASVQQMSGEDWNDVEMTLSTATPSLVATAPQLEPLSIKLGQLQPQQEQAAPLSAADNYALVRRKLVELGKLRGSQAAADRVAPNADASGAMGGAGFAGGQP